MIAAVAPSQVRGRFSPLTAAVPMTSSGFASLIGGLIITSNLAGQIEHFNVLGYIAVACALASLWVALHLRLAPIPQAAAQEART